MAQRDYDLVVYGATGFTGKLICARLAQRAAQEGLRWAMAGRSLGRLESARTDVDTGDAALIEADAARPDTIDALAASTHMVISVVGPYQIHGEVMVKACVEAGTDYVDLSGEPLWMRDMIDRYEVLAKETGARVLFSCGFDSIPAEIGTWTCQQAALRAFGKPVPRIRARMRTFVGGPSGGSVASGMAMMELAGQDAKKAALLADPFALTPGFAGPAHPDYMIVEEEEGLGPVGPFSLGPTDMKNVHRSNFLLGHLYGRDFIYDEKLVNPPPPRPMSPDSLPRPGEGPSAEVMANGRFNLLLIGEEEGREKIRVVVSGDEEPGYRTTSKLIVETALALREADDLAPGIWTPVAALQTPLVERIVENTPIRIDTQIS